VAAANEPVADTRFNFEAPILLCKPAVFLRAPRLAIILTMGTMLVFHCRGIAQSGVSTADSPAGTGLDELKEVNFAALSNPYITPLGTAALSIRPTEWKHAETDNFIYHYFHGFVATPVSVEAEFYYRVIAKDLGKDTSHWERKAHIFIFEQPADWKAFQTKGNLDPWTGGIHAHGELFIQRDPAFKFKGNTLGHETAHLVIDRFYGSNVPIWLNEGYAEYISRVAYASYYRARGYDSHPRTETLAPAAYLPLAQLTNLLTYPSDVRQVVAFYTESEKLVRFLNSVDKTKFQELLQALASGRMMDSALYGAYGSRFASLAALEAEFQPYAVQSANTLSVPLANGRL
jgi:hypothetical protein